MKDKYYYYYFIKNNILLNIGIISKHLVHTRKFLSIFALPLWAFIYPSHIFTLFVFIVPTVMTGLSIFPVTCKTLKLDVPVEVKSVTDNLA